MTTDFSIRCQPHNISSNNRLNSISKVLMSLGWLKICRLKRRSLKMRLLSRRRTLARNTSRRMKALPTLFKYDPPKDIPFESLRLSRPNTPLSFLSHRRRKQTRGELFWNFFKIKHAKVSAATARTRSIRAGNNYYTRKRNGNENAKKKNNTLTNLFNRKSKHAKRVNFYEGIYSERTHFLSHLGNDIPRPLTPRRVHTAPTCLIGASLGNYTYQFGEELQPNKISRSIPPLSHEIYESPRVQMSMPRPGDMPWSKNFDPSTPVGQLNINNLRKQQLKQQQWYDQKFQETMNSFSEQLDFRNTPTPEIPERSLARRFSTPIMQKFATSDFHNKRCSLPARPGEYQSTNNSIQLDTIPSDVVFNSASDINNTSKRRNNYAPSSLQVYDLSSLASISSSRPRSFSVSTLTPTGRFQEKMRLTPIRRKPVGSGPSRHNSITASLVESLAESVKSDDAASEIFDLYSVQEKSPLPEPCLLASPVSSTSHQLQPEPNLPQRHQSQKSFVSYSSADPSNIDGGESEQTPCQDRTENGNNTILHNKSAVGNLNAYYYEEPFSALSTDELLAEFFMLPRADSSVDPDTETLPATLDKKQFLNKSSSVSLGVSDGSFVTAPSSPTDSTSSFSWSSNSSIYYDEDNCSIETVPALVPPSGTKFADNYNPRDSFASTSSSDTTTVVQYNNDRTSMVSQQSSCNDAYLLIAADDLTTRPQSAPHLRLIDSEGTKNMSGVKRAMSIATPRTSGSNEKFDVDNDVDVAVVSAVSVEDYRFDSPIPFMGSLSEFNYYD